jgi:hypothetical protein
VSIARRNGTPLNPLLRGPAVALALAAGAVLAALVLDQGSAMSRDVALLVGSAALYLLLPAALVWLAVALLRLHRAVSVHAVVPRRRYDLLGRPGQPVPNGHGRAGVGSRLRPVADGRRSPEREVGHDERDPTAGR